MKSLQPRVGGSDQAHHPEPLARLLSTLTLPRLEPPGVGEAPSGHVSQWLESFHFRCFSIGLKLLPFKSFLETRLQKITKTKAQMKQTSLKLIPKFQNCINWFKGPAGKCLWLCRSKTFLEPKAARRCFCKWITVGCSRKLLFTKQVLAVSYQPLTCHISDSILVKHFENRTRQFYVSLLSTNDGTFLTRGCVADCIPDDMQLLKVWVMFSWGIHTILSHFAFNSFCDTVLRTSWKVCGNPVSSRSLSPIFAAAFAHFLFLCHLFGNSPNIPKSYYYYG